MYLRLVVLLYAVYTLPVLLSESPDDIQSHLDVLQRYCKMGQLKVKSDKTKIAIFNKGKSNVDFSTKYTDIILEIADNLKYIGVHFCQNESFILNVKKLW